MKQVIKKGVPTLSTTLKSAVFPAAHVEAYRKLCQAGPEAVPLLYPHAFLGPLHLSLLGHPDFPLKLVGSVHARNHVLQFAPLKAATAYDVQLKLCNARRRPQGMEFDLTTDIGGAGSATEDGEVKQPLWTSVSTMLVRSKFAEEDAESPLASAAAKIEGEAVTAGVFPVPDSTGKEYGLLTKDVNPIHMNKWLAKGLGFEQDLAHGMWGLARALPFVAPKDASLPVRLDCIFKGPMYMGRDVRVVCKSLAAPGDAFEYYSGTNPRPSVVGRFVNVGQTEKLQ